VPAVFAKVNGNLVGAVLLGNERSLDGVGLQAQPRLP
jgi:hypothetical protein